jgi:PilZ domain
MGNVNELILRLERLQGRVRYCKQEKRKCIKLLYPPPKRPVIEVGNFHVEVVDISDIGMRIFNYMQHEFGPSIQGMIVFQSGSSYSINGKVVWQFKNELGMLFERIPRLIIEEEAEYLLQYFQEKENKLG